MPFLKKIWEGTPKHPNPNLPWGGIGHMGGIGHTAKIAGAPSQDTQAPTVPQAQQRSIWANFGPQQQRKWGINSSWCWGLFEPNPSQIWSRLCTTHTGAGGLWTRRRKDGCESNWLVVGGSSRPTSLSNAPMGETSTNSPQFFPPNWHRISQNGNVWTQNCPHNIRIRKRFPKKPAGSRHTGSN